MNTLRIHAVVSSLLLAATPALAASDYLLQLDPVQGESQESAGPQTIEVESFSWGVSNSATVATGSGAGTGKVNVQDISMTSVKSPRDVSTGQSTGKRTAAVVESAGPAVAAAPKVGDVATFTVVARESPTKQSLGKNGACATGTHFPHAVIVARGQRYELTDVVVTSCTVSDGLSKKDFRGHVTLMK